MATTPRSQTRTSGFSVRMPTELRRRIRTAAGLDDTTVAEWVLRVLDHVANARIARGIWEEPRREPGLTCEEVIVATAEHYGLAVQELLARPRLGEAIRRQVAVFLCSKFTSASPTEIAAWFWRAHPAVGGAIYYAERGIAESSTVRADVEALTETLEAMKQRGSTDGEAVHAGGPDRDRPEG